MCVFDDDGRQIELDGVGLAETVDGPCGLLNPTGKLFIESVESQTVVSI